MAKDIDNPDKPDFDEDEEDFEDEEGAEADEDIDEDDDSEDSEEDESDDEEDDDGKDDEEDDDEGKDDEEFVMPDKFKGKSAEEIAKSYLGLEKKLDRRANAKAQELVKSMTRAGKKPDKESDKTDEELEKELEQTDFSKMTPKQFAKWTLDQINKRAMNKAQEIFEQANNVKTAVSREIREAQKAHPHLKDNAEYRDIVISLIEAAAAKGKTMTLKEACQKADKAMNIQPKKKGEEDEKKPEEKKKPRTGVEKTQGSDGRENDTEEDKVKKSIMGGGQNKSALGGLGI